MMVFAVCDMICMIVKSLPVYLLGSCCQTQGGGAACRNLGDNSITGVLPADWASGMDSVRGINVTGNSLTGALPGEWSNMTSLQAL